MTLHIPSRRLFLGSAALGAGALLVGCTSNDSGDDGDDTQVSVGEENASPGAEVTIGFSAPAADHGWIAAITRNAEAQAELHDEVTFTPVEAGEDVTAQRAALESLIQQGPDVIVVLPHDGAQLTATAQQAMDAGIPVVNLDRIFSSPLAYRLWIGGDNYGMGVAAGHYIGTRLRDQGVDAPVIAEITGISNLPLTQERSQGFVDALSSYGFRVTNQVSAEFTVDSGQEVTANLLQAAPQLHAVWNHDDDQGIGVLAAIEQAGRDEFFLVGGAGSRDMMEHIQAGGSVVEATVTYSPSMASSAVSLARLVAQSRGMSDLAELGVPKSITLSSETITRDNVEDYLPLGFAS